MLYHFHSLVRKLPATVSMSLICSILLLSAGCASTSPRPAAIVKQQRVQPLPARSAVDAPSVKKGESPAASQLLAKTFEDAVARGDTAWRSGEAEIAVYMYVQALSFRPRDVNTLEKIGSIEQARGSLELAARAYELAASANQNDGHLSARVGLLLVALHEDDKATSWLEKSVESGTDDWRVYDGIGVLALRRGDESRALQYLETAVNLAPNVAAPLLHRGQALYARGNFAAAEESLQAALHLGTLPEAWRLLGQVQAKRRAYADSLNSLLQGLDTPDAYNTAGKLAMDNGDNTVALAYFEKASAVSPIYFMDAQRNAAMARERLSSVSH